VTPNCRSVEGNDERCDMSAAADFHAAAVSIG
jgi:hypothetical protein